MRLNDKLNYLIMRVHSKVKDDIVKMTHSEFQSFADMVALSYCLNINQPALISANKKYNAPSHIMLHNLEANVG